MESPKGNQIKQGKNSTGYVNTIPTSCAIFLNMLWWCLLLGVSLMNHVVFALLLKHSCMHANAWLIRSCAIDISVCSYS